jgi:hypothetical protein
MCMDTTSEQSVGLTARQRAILRAAVQTAFDCGAQDQEPVEGHLVSDEEFSQLLCALRD